MTHTVFLTGGTGFLGTQIAAELVRQEDCRLYVLTRASDPQEGFHRLKAAWQHDKCLYQSIGKNVFPMTGDFTMDGLGLSDADRQTLLDGAVTVIHAGAEIGFQKNWEDLERTNITGTRNMIRFAQQLPTLRRFVHVSTAYVAGTKTGRIMESEPAGSVFSSLYEKSKAEAENLVRASSLPCVICRPGMIVGDSRTGWVRNFNTIYYVLKQLLQGKMRVLPIRPDTRLNLVPVDLAAKSVIRIALSEESEGKTFHLTCPEALAPTAGELTDLVIAWAKKHLGTEISRPVFLPLPFLRQAGMRYNEKKDGRTKSSLNNLLTLLPYFFSEQTFDRTNTDHVCGVFDWAWRDSMDALLAFACRKNFMRQTGQTVFEQAMVRRESSRFPICYYDVGTQGIVKTDGPEVNRRIHQVLSAMWAWGIRRGDRVALTGINSVDYLVLEQAIGLLGAVSVPIYYTTPAQEASVLLQKSGARWFFIGDKRMMKQAENLQGDVRIVTFSAVREIRPASGMDWEAFLSRSGTPAPAQYPDPEDLATIRYTSGTTGEPKGVTFNYSQLSWMGEVLTNLIGWEDRSRPMRYLSFLPLSHVVEGILASYAPYYLLSDVGYYYLNDFGKLTEALPKVRPTVFFSVPRFYEKLWDQVIGNPVGKAWMKARDGVYRKTLGRLLRRVVLKKAGLNHCSQLIVGSAPVSGTLLNNFRALGIEVYNAYGQTEAPLITINRIGDNVIPTIGTALPDTTITAESDGELIVRGPQVTPGYYGLRTENIQDGVLRTGDLGVIHENGHITLFGRKKDFIITAYGKNISIPKIEQRLKDIPGVSEAVLIGENRPYCTALVWLEAEVPDLDEQIAQVNQDLSHPEQIRKYRVIPTALSIQAGELTPNLKVKRGNVEKHYAQEIEEMYS